MARKRCAAKSGRVRKRDFTPPDAIRLDEIVEEIVDSLRPWKTRMSEAQVTTSVIQSLGMLVKFAALEAAFSDRNQNRVRAQQLDSALAEVETLLTSAPSILAVLLFNPLPPLIMTEDGELTQDILSIEDIERRLRKRADSFTAEVNRLRRICTRVIDHGLGPHPNYDSAKHTSAWFAHGLMRGLSDGKITGTEDDPFRVITSLLYEACSGQRDADLKRACDTVLRDNRGPEPGTD